MSNSHYTDVNLVSSSCRVRVKSPSKSCRISAEFMRGTSQTSPCASNSPLVCPMPPMVAMLPEFEVRPHFHTRPRSPAQSVLCGACAVLMRCSCGAELCGAAETPSTGTRSTPARGSRSLLAMRHILPKSRFALCVTLVQDSGCYDIGGRARSLLHPRLRTPHCPRPLHTNCCAGRAAARQPNCIASKGRANLAP